MARSDFFAPLCIRRFFGAKKAYPLFIFFTFFCFSFFFSACSEDSDPERTVYPLEKELYAMFPNDPGLGDSIDANLSTGVLMIVHPDGLYTLSFDADSAFDAPKMQLFRTYSKQGGGSGISKIETVKPQVVDGRYVFTFVCEENEKSLWALTLVENNDYYKGKTRNVKFEGSGKYSNHLSLNLIPVGLIDPIEGVDDIAGLSRLLVKAFRKNYTSFVIDTIYVNYAEDHPTLGHKYSPDRYWRAESPSKGTSLSELGNWPAKGVTEALDIVLVHRIDELNVLGFAGLFAANLVGGDESTVIVGSHVLTTTGERALPAEEIVKVAVHETGHFFGLRHTTSTWVDLENYHDLSVLEDGFEDTPYCPDLLTSGLYKKGEGKASVDYRMPYYGAKMMDSRAYGVAFNESDCPDAYLFMFPVSSEKTMTEFSKQQLKVLKQNLMLIPH